MLEAEKGMIVRIVLPNPLVPFKLYKLKTKQVMDV